MTLPLSITRRRSYTRCARHHKLAYVDRISPRRKDAALDLGSLVHSGIEALWKDEPILITHEDPFIAAQARAMLSNYESIWPEMGKANVLAVEPRFECPLIHPYTGEVHPHFHLKGFVDLILGTEDSCCIVEHKTTTADVRNAADGYWQKLALDDQLTAYVVGAASLGFTVSDIVYDVIRKPGKGPMKATPEAKRKYKKDGGLYANQREHDETPEEYEARLLDLYADADSYYFRRPVTRSEEQLAEGLLDLWHDADRMALDMDLGRYPKNPEACFKFGRPCEFFDICAYGVDPVDSSQFEVREVKETAKA